MHIDRTRRLRVGEGINRPASLFTLQVYHRIPILSTPFLKLTYIFLRHILQTERTVLIYAHAVFESVDSGIQYLL